jgi:hypothetical protein
MQPLPYHILGVLRGKVYGHHTSLLNTLLNFTSKDEDETIITNYFPNMRGFDVANYMKDRRHKAIIYATLGDLSNLTVVIGRRKGCRVPVIEIMLPYAAGNGHLHIIQKFMIPGTIGNLLNTLHWACLGGNQNVIDHIISRPRFLIGELMFACQVIVKCDKVDFYLSLEFDCFRLIADLTAKEFYNSIAKFLELRKDNPVMIRRVIHPLMDEKIKQLALLENNNDVVNYLNL